MTALDTVKQYYQNFNDRNWNGMLALLHDEIRHEANQGDVRIGLEKFERIPPKNGRFLRRNP